MKKYTYTFTDMNKTYSETFTNDDGLVKNVLRAKGLAETYGWKLKSVREK